MSVIAFIPARGGSKGIPKKNIKKLLGKPLIVWSIDQVKASKGIDRIIVSTDCPEIAVTARKFGAEVPFLRPDDLSGDLATTESAMLHCCNFLIERNELPDKILLIQATSPIRGQNVLDDALSFMEEGGYDSVLSVSKSHRFTWKGKDSPKASYNYKLRPRRQDITKVDQEYLETGSFYITKTDEFLKNKNRLCGKIGLFETPEIESFEIDSPTDFLLIETLLKTKMIEEQ